MKPTFAVGAVYLACQMTLTASPVAAVPQSNSATNSTTKNASKSTDHTPEQMSHLATRLLQKVDQARQALSTKQTQTAAGDINQALADRNQLASIAKAKGRPMIVPLYSELDQTSVLRPILTARNGGKQQPSTSAPITVNDATAQFTFAGLDLDKAKTRLDAAKTALQNNNSQAAADSLAAIGNDLVVQTVQTDVPLLASRENLGIAKIAVKNNKDKEATAALKEASTALDRYAGESSAHHASDAKSLAKQIDSFAPTLAQNHAGATSKIDGWWHQVDNWLAPPAQS